MEDEIDIIEYISIIWKRRRLLLLIVSVTTVISIIVSLLLTPIYGAKTSFILKASSNTNNQISSLINSNVPAGLSWMLSESPAIADLKEIINSSLIAERVLDKLDLVAVFQKQSDEKLTKTHFVRALSDKIEIDNAEYSNNVIVLKVEDKSPTLAANIANTYVQEIDQFYQDMNYKNTLQRKKFIEEQLFLVKAQLNQIENKYKNFSKLSGLAAAGSSSIEGIRLMRELEIQSNLYILLKKEDQALEMDIARAKDIFMILEKAVVPDGPIRPSKKKFVIVSVLISLLMGLIIIFLVELIFISRKKFVSKLNGK